MPAAADEAYVALLRGINVGGKNKLPMKSLTGLFAEAGCHEVRTYVQSGNVIFRYGRGRLDGLAEQIRTGISERFGLKVPVILRSAAEMHEIVAKSVFVKAGIAVELLHVYFLAEFPQAGTSQQLDYERSPGDTFVLSGREIYLHLPNGVARTKLTNMYFDRQLGTVSTLRNWRTVVALAEMLKEVS